MDILSFLIRGRLDTWIFQTSINQIAIIIVIAAIIYTSDNLFRCEPPVACPIEFYMLIFSLPAAIFWCEESFYTYLCPVTLLTWLIWAGLYLNLDIIVAPVAHIQWLEYVWDDTEPCWIYHVASKRHYGQTSLLLSVALPQGCKFNRCNFHTTFPGKCWYLNVNVTMVWPMRFRCVYFFQLDCHWFGLMGFCWFQF